MSAWGLAVVIGVLMAGQQQPGRVDRMLIRQVHAMVGDRGKLAELLLAPTDTGVIAAAAVLLVVIALVRRRWDVVVLAVAGPAIAVGLAELVLKPVFDRRLYGLLSYPSGHAVASVAVYTVATMALTSGATRLWRRIAAAGWGLLTIVVMTGLVAMNCHYPTDTVGGVCVAVGVILPCALVSDTITHRHRAKVPIPMPRLRPAQGDRTGVRPVRSPRAQV
ncbi:MAG TPA: phosphatase PAP2 family protein [Pseudonocardiaceae bacterium]